MVHRVGRGVVWGAGVAHTEKPVLTMQNSVVELQNQRTTKYLREGITKTYVKLASCFQLVIALTPAVRGK